MCTKSGMIIKNFFTKKIGNKNCKINFQEKYELD